MSLNEPGGLPDTGQGRGDVDADDGGDKDDGAWPMNTVSTPV